MQLQVCTDGLQLSFIKEKRLWNSLTLLSKFFRLWLSLWVPVLAFGADLAPGRLKLKWGGGTAGHNGLKSIAGRLGTQDFHRLRVGVGRPPDAANVVSWVLGRFNAEEKPSIEAALPKAVDAVLHFAVDGPERAANAVNTRRKSG